MSETIDSEETIKKLKEECAKGLGKCISEAAEASKNQNEHLINFGLLGIKYTFMLNGAAAIAVTTMFTSIFLQKEYLANEVLHSILFFCYGTGLSVLAAIFLFMAQYLYKRHFESIRKHYIYYKGVIEEKVNKQKTNIKGIIWELLGFHIFCLVAFLCVMASLYYSWQGINTAAAPFEKDLTEKSQKNDTPHFSEDKTDQSTTKP